MSNRYRSDRYDRDMIALIVVLICLIVASYYLGRMRALHESSFAFCKALFGETPRHQECMEERPWEDK